MTNKKTDRMTDKKKLHYTRLALIDSRRECAELRRKLEEAERAALTVIAMYGKQ